MRRGLQPLKEIQPQREWRAEIATSFELYRELASRVREQCRTGFSPSPLVLSGHCGATIAGSA